MLSAIRSIARVSCKRTAAATFTRTVAPVRFFAAASSSSTPPPPTAYEIESNIMPTAAEIANSYPADLPLRQDVDGVKWADYRAENLRTISAVRNEDGDLVGQFEGEEVIFPDLEPTLEWVLSTPVDLHLFEEAPIIKMYQEESQ